MTTPDCVITGWTAQWVKDAQAVLDFAVDWSVWMTAEDYLVGVDFQPSSSDIKVISQTVGDTLGGSSNCNAVVWLAGGVAGTTYTVTCHVTTAGGRQDDRTFSLIVENL